MKRFSIVLFLVFATSNVVASNDLLMRLSFDDIQKKAENFDNQFKKVLGSKVALVAGVVAGGAGTWWCIRKNRESATESEGDTDSVKIIGGVKGIWIGAFAMATTFGLANGITPFVSKTFSDISNWITHKLFKSKLVYPYFVQNAQFTISHLLQLFEMYNSSIKEQDETLSQEFIDGLKDELIATYSWFVTSQTELFGFMLAKAKRKQKEKVGFVALNIERIIKHQNQFARHLEMDLGTGISLQTNTLFNRFGQMLLGFLKEYEHVVIAS